jgi:deoxyribonuclease V
MPLCPIHVRDLHPWRLDYHEACRVQEGLRTRLSFESLRRGDVHYVAGADIAVSKKLDRLVAAVVVMSFPGLDLVESQVTAAKSPFPYVPGLLSFRELPVLTRCLGRVKTRIDLMLCDAQGIAHPRGLGLASHLGLLIEIPTIGCAKSRLVGEHGEPGPLRGDFTRLVFDGKRVGSVLRTRDRVKPLYISPGHRIDQASARRMTLACTTRYRLPEPTRLAHIIAGEEKRRRERSAR